MQEEIKKKKKKSSSKVKTIFVGRNVTFSEIDRVEDALPVGHYALNFDPRMGQYFLTTRKAFKLPPKLYSDPQVYVDRFLKTYRARGTGMGVLLSGDKGTGKTLMAKMLANQCGMPVICITAGFTGQPLTEFIEMLQVPCMFFVDEFEKLYQAGPSRNKEPEAGSPSEYFLTLLDGTAANRHLWVLTSNSHDVGEYFTGRPGRIRYHKEFHGLDHGMITEIIQDCVKSSELAAATIKTALSISNISLDALMSIIEEVNIHEEAPEKFLQYFNVASDTSATFSGVLHRKQYYVPETAIRSLPPEQQMLGRSYARSVTSYKISDPDYFQELTGPDGDYEGVHKLISPAVEELDLLYTASYAQPFDTSASGATEVNMTYMRLASECEHYNTSCPGIQQYMNFTWEEHEIAKITQEDTTITVYHTDGLQKLVLRPAKRKARNYSFAM